MSRRGLFLCLRRRERGFKADASIFQIEKATIELRPALRRFAAEGSPSRYLLSFFIGGFAGGGGVCGGIGRSSCLGGGGALGTSFTTGFGTFGFTGAGGGAIGLAIVILVECGGSVTLCGAFPAD